MTVTHTFTNAYYHPEFFEQAVDVIDRAIKYSVDHKEELIMAMHPTIWEYIYENKNGKIEIEYDDHQMIGMKCSYKQCQIILDLDLKSETSYDEIYGFCWNNRREMKFVADAK